MASIPSPFDKERATPRNRMQFQEEARPDYRGAQAEIALTGEIGKFGEQLFRATEYLASVKAEDGANQLRDAENELHIELLGKKGADANVDLQKEFREKRDASVKAISEKLGGRAGSIFSGNAARGSAPYDARVINYQMDEQKKYAETVRLTGNETRNQTAYQARDQASLAGLINEQRTSSYNHQALKLGKGQSEDDISKMPLEKQAAARKSEVERLATMAVLTQKDTGDTVLSTMQGALDRGDTAFAAKVLQDNGISMTGDQYERAQKILKPNVDAQAGEEAANAAWKRGGPVDQSDAVNMFNMEKDVREQFKGNKERTEAGLSTLKQMATSFNSQQAESTAANINGLYKRLDGGASLRSLRATQEWINLPADKRHAVEKEWLAWQDSRTTNELSIIRDREKLALYRNGDEFIIANDPNVLSKMKSRAQVEALRPKFGMEATKQLADKYDELQKPGAMREAQIDQDAFNVVAHRMGMNPYNSKLSEEKKRELGMLKYRVENIIESEQQKQKRTLSRSEKDGLMETEIARPKVTIDPGTFSRNVEKLPIQVQPKDKVVIPPEERVKIIEALQEMSKRYPNNPNFKANEDNVRRYYTK